MPVSRRQFLRFSALAVVAHAGLGYGTDNMPAVPQDLDHILLGVDDLDRGMAWFEERSGVHALPGGVHPGRGTRNALLSFGSRRYLEIIAPDPAQAKTSNPMVDRLRALQQPRLVGWAVHTGNLNSLLQKATSSGTSTDGPWDGSRSRPDGRTLRWRSFVLKEDFRGLLPFFIEWNVDSVHPSKDAPTGCSLRHFSIESPTPSDVEAVARKLHLEVEIRSADKPALKARIVGKKGAFELD